jgi:hypothetical protein
MDFHSLGSSPAVKARFQQVVPNRKDAEFRVTAYAHTQQNRQPPQSIIAFLELVVKNSSVMISSSQHKAFVNDEFLFVSPFVCESHNHCSSLVLRWFHPCTS